MGDTNFLEVEVNVVTPGSYFIRTDTVNGYSFKTTSNFFSSGNMKVRLPASGKPITAGSNQFTVFYDTSICSATVNVLDTGKVLSPAVFKLNGAPGQCMNATVMGSFVQNSVLDTTAKVSIELDVSSPGTYSVNTNAVNGYNFSGSGIINAAGIQTVTLTANGKPVLTGTDTFRVTAGSSTCTFTVKVVTAVATTNADYFPLTTNSYWVYDDLFNVGDSIKRVINDSIQLAGRQYKVMEEIFQYGVSKKYLFRKVVTDYFEYAPVASYTVSVAYAQLENEIPILKENLATGDQWQSPEYSGTATFGQVIILQYMYSCLNANVTVTINGKTFVNVYKIEMRPRLKAVGGIYGYTNEIYTLYYAKGIGLVYLKKLTNGFTQAEMQIRNWQVK